MKLTNEQNANPLESIIDFAWSCGADRFWVNNAKDELKKMRKIIDNFYCMLDNPVAWAKINSHGDLFDISLQYNPNDSVKQLPLFKE